MIVRKLTFVDAEDDAINVGQQSHHIRIDHNPYTLDPAASVPALVQAGAAAGKA